jgi:glycosyltransferase involved in cell wall biosynthesis
MKKDKIIFLSKFIPVNSATGAMQRNIEWLKFFQKRYDVILIGLERATDRPDERNKTIMDKCNEVVSIPPSWLDQVRAVAYRLIFNQPLWIGKYFSRSLDNKIKTIVSKNKVSFIFCSELSTFRYAQVFKKNIPIYLDEHNVEFALTNRLAHISKGFKKILYTFDVRPLMNYEKKAIRASRHIYTVSEDDKKILIDTSEENANKFTLVNNSFSYKGSLNTKALSQSPSITFVGNLNWLPNKQGLIHFLEVLWPIISKRLPKLELRIIGSGSIKDYEQYAGKQNNISFYPNASEKSKNTLIDDSWVCIVPLYAGGGTRIKIIEYWAHSKAVVSTSIGAEGLRLSSGTIVENSDKEFADTIVKMVTKGKRYCQKLGDDNYINYKNYYVSERIYEDSLYNTLAP